jgi:hypothetical protein
MMPMERAEGKIRDISLTFESQQVEVMCRGHITQQR